MPTVQTFKNHGRIDPPFHLFVLPILAANFVRTLVMLFQHGRQHPYLSVWRVVFAFALLLLPVVLRSAALRAQNRAIRLEERLRYQTLLGPLELAESRALTLSQIIALRFASDAELPALLKRALAETLTSKQIKQSITVWRPDYDRV